MGLNQVLLHGRLGAAPEIRTSDAGTVYTRLSLATNYRVEVKGEWEERTEWHTIAAFGSLAESLRRLEKGSAIFVVARLRQQTAERDGVRFRYSEIIARQIEFTDPRYADPQQGQQEADPAHPEPPEDDDIEF